MTSDAKLPIATYDRDRHDYTHRINEYGSGQWCRVVDVRGLLYRMATRRDLAVTELVDRLTRKDMEIEDLRSVGTRLAIESMGGSARADKAEERLDRLASAATDLRNACLRMNRTAEVDEAIGNLMRVFDGIKGTT